MIFITTMNLIYLAIVTYLPKFYWEPLTLTQFIKFHNIILICWSLYITVGLISTIRKKGYTIWGNECVCHGDDIQHYTRMFYVSKIYEFIDTFIMIAKRNFHQVSFLHVYHHSTISFIWWYISTYYPCGDSYIPVLLNSVVHIIMYTNYGFNKTKNKLIKKTVTSMQMFQFILMIVHSLRFAFRNSPLGNLCKVQGIYVSSLLYLFSQFFIKTYGPTLSS